LLLLNLKDLVVIDTLRSQFIDRWKHRYVESIANMRFQFKQTLDLLERTLQHPFILSRGLHLTQYYDSLKQEILKQSRVDLISADSIFDVELLSIYELTERIHFASLKFLYIITPDLSNVSDPVSDFSIFMRCNSIVNLYIFFLILFKFHKARNEDLNPFPFQEKEVFFFELISNHHFRF